MFSYYCMCNIYIWSWKLQSKVLDSLVWYMSLYGILTCCHMESNELKNISVLFLLEKITMLRTTFQLWAFSFFVQAYCLMCKRKGKCGKYSEADGKAARSHKNCWLGKRHKCGLISFCQSLRIFTTDVFSHFHNWLAKLKRMLTDRI